jgi:hypothetical protein
MPEPSILDERLAEIDRRLRTIQSGLVPVPDEEPAADFAAPEAGADELREPDDAAEPPPPSGPLRAAPPLDAARATGREPAPIRLVEPGGFGRADQLAELVEAHERLLELHRELLSQYAEVLEQRAGESATVAVTAGPFMSAGTVRAFERALAALPGVSAVTVREYLGDDRVQVDVRLAAG